MSLESFRVHHGFSGRHAKSLDRGVARYPITAPDTIGVASGTSAGQADLFFDDQRTLAASGTENIDLAASLADPAGDTLTFVKLKGIWIYAASANGGNIRVGGAGSNEFQGPFAASGDKITVAPGGIFQVIAPAAGWTVTAGTGDILLIENLDGAAAVTYDIALFGTSA